MGHDQQPEPGGHAGDSGWGAGVPDLVAAIDLIGQGTALAAGASIGALSLQDKRDLMAAMVRARTVTEAAYLHVLSQFDRTPSVVPGTTRRFGYAFLTQRMNVAAGAAAADVAAARQLDPSGSGYDPGLLAETDPTRWTDPAAQSDSTDSAGSSGSTGSTGGDGVGQGGVADPDGVHAVACDITGTGPDQTAGTFAATTFGAASATGGGPGAGAGAGQSPSAGAGPGVRLAVEGLPRMGAALAAALVTRAHVDVAVRCLARVPEHLANRVDAHGVSGRVKIDVFLTRVSRQHPPSTTDRIAKELLAALDPDGQESFDPLAYKRRTLSLVTDSTGMTSLRGLLDPASAAILRAALAHYRTLTAHHLDDGDTSTSGSGSGDSGGSSGSGDSGGGWAVPGQESIPIRDDRSRGMRDVDALTAMCEAALRAHYPTIDDGGPGMQPAAPLVKVIITATPEQAAAARRTTPGPLDDHGVPLRPPWWPDPWDDPHARSHHSTGTHPPGSGTRGQDHQPSQPSQPRQASIRTHPVIQTRPGRRALPDWPTRPNRETRSVRAPWDGCCATPTCRPSSSDPTAPSWTSDGHAAWPQRANGPHWWPGTGAVSCPAAGCHHRSARPTT